MDNVGMKARPDWVTDPVKLARWFVWWLKRHADAGMTAEESVRLLVANARMRGATTATMDTAFQLVALEAEAEEGFSRME